MTTCKIVNCQTCTSVSIGFTPTDLKIDLIFFTGKIPVKIFPNFKNKVSKIFAWALPYKFIVNIFIDDGKLLNFEITIC